MTNAMNTHTLLLAAILLASSPLAKANVTVRAHVTHEHANTLVDVVADISDCALRSFGIQLKFDPDTAELQSMGRYEGIWYLADEEGTHVPYIAPEVVEPGCIRVVGGRLDGRMPSSGVSGNGILLGTFVFQRKKEAEPTFALTFASPPPFANFVCTEGGSLDQEVILEQEPSIEPPIEDSDLDGLPDHYEEKVFGSLKASDGESTDSDGDGLNDFQEWLAGSDPKDKESNTDLALELQPDGSIMLEWATMDGRAYDLEWSSQLGEFEPLVTGLTGVNRLLDHTKEERGFYRLRVRNPRAGDSSPQ